MKRKNRDKLMDQDMAKNLKWALIGQMRKANSEGPGQGEGRSRRMPIHQGNQRERTGSLVKRQREEGEAGRADG